MLIQLDDDNYIKFVPENSTDSFQLGILSRKLTEMSLAHRLEFVYNPPEMKGLNMDKKILMEFIGF